MINIQKDLLSFLAIQRFNFLGDYSFNKILFIFFLISILLQ